MVLQTERLTLQPLGTGDFAGFHRYASDPENTRMMLFMPMEGEADSMRYLTEREAQWNAQPQMIYEFAVLQNGTLIGSVSLDLLPEQNGELGWILDRRYWGQGYVAEAAKALVQLAGQLGIKRLIAHCDSENTASRRVMEKLGMVLVGITSGRKNRGSDEIRQECLYEMHIGSEDTL